MYPVYYCTHYAYKVSNNILAHCIIPRLIFHRKNTNYKMFREMVIKLYILFFFDYIPDKINYLRVGWINFIYITIEVMHYTCL